MIEIIFIVALLAIMEVSLSFDNAVVNAVVLEKMPEVWRRCFLTWGMLIAVVGMRLVFPVLIVAITAGLGVGEVIDMAIEDPEQYSRHVKSSHIQIGAFGGMFLLLVFLHFILDSEKDTHWLGWIEEKLSYIGKLEAIQIPVALAVLIALLPEGAELIALISGLAGIATFILIKAISSLLMTTSVSAGLAGFLYLEVLDMSFSLDGVIGAFALSSNIFVIMSGLGIGAYFVRRLTLRLVRKGTLDEYVYLEHGAHYGIGALAIIMLVGMSHHISEVITGLTGVAFIGLSLMSSIQARWVKA